MKTLYSSTFLSLIIAFFAFLGVQVETITIIQNIEHSFSNIEKPLPKAPDSETDISPITVEIFYSFGCSGCSSFGLNTIPALQEKYLEDEDVDLKLYITPVSDDKGQYYSAVGVKCASEYGKYWEMHNKIHSTPEPLSSREVDLLAQELELPVMEFRSCLKSGKYDEEIEGNNCKLFFWDIAGQEEFNFMRPTFYKGSKAAIIVFNHELNDHGKESFEAVKNWHDDITKFCGELPIVLFGNKVDLVDPEKIDTASPEQLVKDRGFLGYYKTSAKTGEGVYEAFQAIIKDLYNKFKDT